MTEAMSISISYILFLGIYGAYDDYQQQKTKKMTEASALVCLLLAIALNRPSKSIHVL